MLEVKVRLLKRVVGKKDAAEVDGAVLKYHVDRKDMVEVDGSTAHMVM